MITEVRAISHLLLMALIFPISQNDSVFFLAPYSQTKGTEWALVFKCLSGVPLNTTGHFQFECTCKSNATVHLGISTALRGERKNGFRGLFPKSNKRVGHTSICHGHCCRNLWLPLLNNLSFHLLHNHAIECFRWATQQ